MSIWVDLFLLSTCIYPKYMYMLCSLSIHLSWPKHLLGAKQPQILPVPKCVNYIPPQKCEVCLVAVFKGQTSLVDIFKSRFADEPRERRKLLTKMSAKNAFVFVPDTRFFLPYKGQWFLMIFPDFKIFFFQIPLCLKFLEIRELSTKERKKYCVQTSSFLFVEMWRCGESVNPPKIKHPGGSGGFVLLTKGRPRSTTHFSGFFTQVKSHWVI